MTQERRSRTWLWILLGLFAFGSMAGCGGLVFLVAKMGNKASQLPKEGVLRIKLEGELRDHVVEDPLYELFSEETPTSFSALLTDLRKAQVDPRVKVVLFDIESFGGGWGKADELRAAIARVREAGKPVYAQLGVASNIEYYLALACDEILVAPGGMLFTNGLAAEVTFFRGSLDKLGVYPDVFQIGRYKNAPDQFTRTDMSEAHREVINAVLDDQFGRFVAAVAQARKLDEAEVRALVDRSPLVAPEALEAKLVDALVYPEQLEDRLVERHQLKPRGKDEDFPVIETRAYREVTPQSVGLEKGAKVGILFASGAINTGESQDDPMGGSAVGSDTVVRALEKAAEDEEIRAIILRVDSPGGSAFASDLIWAAVEKVKAAGKPVIVSMSDVAASGGYYIAANADRILAEPSTITGSIGIFAGKPVVKGLFDKLGITTEYVLRGKNAGLFRATEPFNEEERARFEAVIRHTYEKDFLPKVANGRGKELAEIDAVAQGRVWTGAQGREVGLVDEFGGLDRAVELAKELAKLPASVDPERVVLPTPKTLLEQLFDPSETASTWVARETRKAQAEALPPELRRLAGYARVLEGMRRGEAMALLPFDLRIR